MLPTYEDLTRLPGSVKSLPAAFYRPMLLIFPACRKGLLNLTFSTFFTNDGLAATSLFKKSVNNKGNFFLVSASFRACTLNFF